MPRDSWERCWLWLGVLQLRLLWLAVKLAVLVVCVYALLALAHLL